MKSKIEVFLKEVVGLPLEKIIAEVNGADAESEPANAEESRSLALQVGQRILYGGKKGGWNIDPNRGRVTHPFIIHPTRCQNGQSRQNRWIIFPDNCEFKLPDKCNYQHSEGNSYGIASTGFFRKWEVYRVKKFLDYVGENYAGTAVTFGAGSPLNLDLSLSQKDFYFGVSGRLSHQFSRQTLILFNAERSFVERMNDSVRRFCSEMNGLVRRVSKGNYKKH